MDGNLILLVLDDNTGQWQPQTPNGYNKLILPGDIKAVIDDLISYSQMYTDEEIIEYNRQLEEHFFDSFKCSGSKRNNKRDTSGFIYVLRCADKYKVGYSKDVNRRIQQLDTRPFKLKLVYQQYSDCAYDIEQEIHRRLKSYSIENEWYDIEEKTLFRIIKEIVQTVEDELK